MTIFAGGVFFQNFRCLLLEFDTNTSLYTATIRIFIIKITY